MRAVRRAGWTEGTRQPGRWLRGREPSDRPGAEPGRVPQPHEARVEGVPRGLLLQAARRQGAARPARRRARGALRMPEQRGLAAHQRRRDAQGAHGRGLVPGSVRQGPLLHGGPGPRAGRADQGDRRDAPDRGGDRRADRGHQRLALPRGRPLARARGAPLHPDRLHAERPEPLEVLHRGVLREVRGGDGGGLRRDAGGVHQHRAGRRAVRSDDRLRHLPPAQVHGARDPHAEQLPGGARAPGPAPAVRRDAERRARRAAASRAGRDREDGLRRVLPRRVGLHPLRARAGDRGGAGPWLVGGLARRVLPWHYEHRSDQIQPPVRTIPESRANLDARHGHRFCRRQTG